MDQLLLDVVDSHELLTSVSLLGHPGLPKFIECIGLQFGPLVAYIWVDAEFDELKVGAVPPDHLELRNSRCSLLEEALGKKILWSWSLTNHQGYRDGIQIGFMVPGAGIASTTVQLIGVATTLEIFEVIERQMLSI